MSFRKYTNFTQSKNKRHKTRTLPLWICRVLSLYQWRKATRDKKLKSSNQLVVNVIYICVQFSRYLQLWSNIYCNQFGDKHHLFEVSWIYVRSNIPVVAIGMNLSLYMFIMRVAWNGPLTRYVKLQVVHAPGMPGTFSPAADFKGNC